MTLFLAVVVTCVTAGEPAEVIGEADVPASGDTTYTTICSNQLPYDWNGIACLGGGIYGATLVGSGGLDSIVYLNLTVINVSTSIANVKVCDNYLPYTWNGNSYSTNGTYSVTLTGAGGCDSVAILSLTVSNTVTSTTNTSICSNQLPFAWNGNNYGAAGTYTAILTSSAGCDSIATLNLTIRLVRTSNTSASTCSNQLPFFWNGQPYPAAGIYSITLNGSNGCDSIATLNLTVRNTTASLTRDSICTPALPYVWNGNNYNVTGTYSVQFTGSNGCDSVATLQLQVNPIITTTSYDTICTAQLPYSWNGNMYNSAGLYQVVIPASTGCDSTPRIRLTVVNNFTSITDRIVCSTELPFNWNGNQYNSSGTYTVSFTTNAGCDSIATLNLTVFSPSVKTDTVRICENQLPYTWYGHTFTAAGVYPINPPVSITNCYAVDTLVLIVLFVVPSTSQRAVCSNELPYVWNGNSYFASGLYGVSLVSSTGCDSIANLNLTVREVPVNIIDTSMCSSALPFVWNGLLYDSAVSVTDTLIAANGCDSVVILNFSVNNSSRDTALVKICNAQLPYSWNGNIYNSGGFYPLTFTNSIGCDSVVVLDLRPFDFLTDTTSIVICSSQLPYTFNGTTYINGGVYADTLVSSGGCDSISVFRLFVNHVVTSTTFLSVCNDQFPYNWNGTICSGPGTFSILLLTTAGCDSLATLILSVYPVDTTITNKAICTNQLPYSWNGNSYPFAGTFPVTLVSNAGCDSVAILQLSVTDILTSTTNVIICDNLMPYVWNGNTYTTAGTYSVTLTNAAGCDSVPILSLATVSFYSGTVNASICINQLPYLWNGNNYSTAGSYTFQTLTAYGCDSVATLNLEVLPLSAGSQLVAVCDNNIPYSWQGNNYNSSGVYTAVIPGANGCDSTATLQLTVNPVRIDTVSVTICENHFPYSWNGNSYTGIGNYSVTLTGSSGCDSVVTLQLTSNSVLTSTTTAQVCANQLPYSWNGNTYTVSGTYTLLFTGSNGCDSIAQLQLTVAGIDTTIIAFTLCSNELPFNWNGQNFTSAGLHTVVLTGDNGCDSVVQLQLTVNPVTQSNTSVSTCANQLPFVWNGQFLSITGTYSVNLAGSVGCDSTAILQLTVNPVRRDTVSVTICENQFPYSWNGNSYAVNGIYSVTLTSSSGCDSVVTLQLTSNSVLTSTTTALACNNQLPYLWNGNTYTASGTYTVLFTSSGGCDSIAQLQLTVAGIDTTIIAFTICSNELPFNWNGQNYTNAGLHTVVLTGDNGCDSAVQLQLTVNPVTQSNISVSACANQLPFVWNGQSLNSTGNYSVTLTGSLGCDSVARLSLVVIPIDSTQTNITICSNNLPYVWNGNAYTQSGQYAVILNGVAGCDSVASLSLLVIPSPPPPSVISPLTYCQFDVASPLQASGTGTMLWYDSPADSTATTQTPVPSTLIAGLQQYQVRQSENGCTSLPATITVMVNRKPVLGPDKEMRVCFGESILLDTIFALAAVGGVGIWTRNGMLVSPLKPISHSGNFQFVFVSNEGCRDTALFRFLVQPQVNAFAGPDGTAERNFPYQLQGSGGVTYLWSPGFPLLNNANIPNPTATLGSDTIFVLEVQDEIGCTDRDTVAIRVLDGPAMYIPNAFTPNGDGINDIFKPIPVGIAELEYFMIYNRFGILVYQTNKIHQGWDGRFKGIDQPMGGYVWKLKGTNRKGQVRFMKGNVLLIR